MKCWITSAALLLVVSTAMAEENAPLPFYLDTIDEYSLDFSEADLFIAPAALEAEWLPPPAPLQDNCPCPHGSCPVEFAPKCEQADLLICPIPTLAGELFATLAAATEIKKCEKSKCACGEKCGCKSGDKSKCACGEKCACDKGTCKCGKNCQCAKNGSNGKCACGPKCQCGKTSIAKAARCGNACQVQEIDAGRRRFFAHIAAHRSSQCECGALCTCGDAKVASMKHELDVAYQQLRFEQRLAQLQVENLRREYSMMAELAEARAQAAAHQAALSQQSIAQHQQQELVGHIVRLTGGDAKGAADNGHLQSRIEQLTIENVQLRHTIEELRKHVEQLAREPSRSR